EQALAMTSSRENADYLPGIELDPNLQIGCEPRPVLMEAEVVLFACPSKALRETCRMVVSHLDAAWSARAFLALCKGLDPETHQLPHEVLRDELGEKVAVGYLTGPTCAREVAEGKPAAMVLAAEGEEELIIATQRACSTESLRVYRSDDLRGVGFGSCLKNVYAIAAGIGDGLSLGDNARAALLTRSLSEMVELGQQLGGRRETYYGLSGFGDLVATCSGDWSRNRTLGLRIGAGESATEIVEGQPTVVEGYWATASFHELCQDKGLAAPILNEIHAVLHEGKEPREALLSLMTRDLRVEG
ncbi:MAG: NAD(P)H-dependent glycerol-3-phosphate dehydrogenase, partial [Opitutales bacterium]